MPIVLATPLIWFAVGLVMALQVDWGISPTSSTSKSMTPEYERPFSRDNDKSKRYRHWGEWARWIGVIAALGGIVAVSSGLYTAYSAFQHFPLATSGHRRSANQHHTAAQNAVALQPAHRRVNVLVHK